MAGLMVDDSVVDGGGQQRGQQRGPKHGDKTMGGGPTGHGLLVHCASAAGGKGPYNPAAASAAIHDHCVPRAAGTHLVTGLMAQWLDGLNSLMA